MARISDARVPDSPDAFTRPTTLRPVSRLATHSSMPASTPERLPPNTPMIAANAWVSEALSMAARGASSGAIATIVTSNPAVLSSPSRRTNIWPRAGSGGSGRSSATRGLMGSSPRARTVATPTIKRIAKARTPFMDRSGSSGRAASAPRSASASRTSPPEDAPGRPRRPGWSRSCRAPSPRPRRLRPELPPGTSRTTRAQLRRPRSPPSGRAGTPLPSREESPRTGNAGRARRGARCRGASGSERPPRERQAPRSSARRRSPRHRARRRRRRWIARSPDAIRSDQLAPCCFGGALGLPEATFGGTGTSAGASGAPLATESVGESSLSAGAEGSSRSRIVTS